MNFKLGQKIIDIVRGKHLLNKYKILQETVKYISSQIGFDTEIASGILSEHKFPYFTFKKDEAILKRYIKTINASEFPKAVGILREHQMKLLDLVKEVVPDLESNNFHPFMIGGTLLGAVRHGGFIP